MIYLDYNATTPIHPDVKKAMEPFWDKEFGNPSCSYTLGKKAYRAIEKARAQVASLINARENEIVFTSGGTESNNTVFKGILWALKKRGNHVITTQIEHPSIINPALFMEQLGFEISFVPPNKEGIVDPQEIKRHIKKETVLISVMHANNETGAIQPIAEISKMAKEYNIVLHSDAAQSLGKIRVDVNKLGVDLLTIAGHKLYAPKGIGALYVRKDIPFLPLIHGAGQEMGRRAGTENVPYIVALGKACEILQKRLANGENERIAYLRDKLWNGIKDLNVVRFSPPICLPNTLFVGFKGLLGQDVLNAIPEILASTGAACHSKEIKLSHVLAAMGVSFEEGKGAVRFSIGYFSTEEEINRAIELIREQVPKLQEKTSK